MPRFALRVAQHGHLPDAGKVLHRPDRRAARPIAGALYADLPLEVLEAEAGLRVDGDRALVARFLALFALPPKIA